MSISQSACIASEERKKHKDTTSALNNFDLCSLFTKKMRCAVITYYLRSGSYFLHSLLDGHSKLLCLPPWSSAFFQMKNCVDEIDVYFLEPEKSVFCEHVTNLMQPSSAWVDQSKSTIYPFLGEKQAIPIDAPIDTFVFYLKFFIDFLKKHDLVTSKNYFLSFAIAYNLVQGKSILEIAHTTTLVYQLHTPDESALSKIINDFEGNIFYIQTIKHPIYGLDSHLKLWHNENAVTPFIFAARDGNIPLGLSKEVCVAVKNEYLHAYQDAYTKRLLCKMDLEWEDICGKSTVNGLTFWWIKKDKIFTGFNKAISFNLKSSYFDSYDRAVLSYLFQKRCQAWNYAYCSEEKLARVTNIVEETKLSQTVNGMAFFEKMPTLFRHELRSKLLLSLNIFKDKQFKKYSKTIIQILLAHLLEESVHKPEDIFMPLLNEDGLRAL